MKFTSQIFTAEKNSEKIILVRYKPRLITGFGVIGYEFALLSIIKRVNYGSKKIKKLMELLEESGIAEIEVKEGEE